MKNESKFSEIQINFWGLNIPSSIFLVCIQPGGSMFFVKSICIISLFGFLNIDYDNHVLIYLCILWVIQLTHI